MEKLTKTNVLWRLIWNKLQRLPVLVGGKIRGGNLLFVMLHPAGRNKQSFWLFSDFWRRFVTLSLFLFEVLMNQWGEWSEVCPAKFCSHRESEWEPSWRRERGKPGLELGHLNIEPVQSSQKYTSEPLAIQHL